MELEELKLNWAALNERINNVEMVNERLVKGMIELRTQSIFGRIFDQQRNSQNLGLLFILCYSIRYLSYRLYRYSSGRAHSHVLQDGHIQEVLLPGHSYNLLNSL